MGQACSHLAAWIGETLCAEKPLENYTEIREVMALA